MSFQYAASYATSEKSNMKTATSMWQRLVRQSQYDAKGRPRTRLAIIRRRLLRLPTAIVLLWLFVLHWGERGTFSASVESCKWEKWEHWPPGARPHRVVLIADPQLVDPHTYPGRPWPLSALTIAATDKYIKRSYRLLQRDIDPDTIFFLGDLFDGGREWSTHHQGFTPSADQWKQYGDAFWWKEYERFGKIFFDQSQVTGGLGVHKGKKFIASLPGNHDLGFGNGVQLPVRNRFRAFFGESDRIDIVGNHSFVSLDTVSLSAMGQPDSPAELWNSTLQFLEQAEELKARAVRTELALQQGVPTSPKLSHTVSTLDGLHPQPKKAKVAKEARPEFPTIVLSHVPLYRDSGTPCGPLREKYPPSAANLKSDEPNAIRVAAGYQYQNVLTHEISKAIAEKVGNVGHAFSGDDHDYCEVVHSGYPSASGTGIREITVKSISWAMGIRRPGLQLVSLWNPVDSTGEPLRAPTEPTLQTQLCLLPDQLHVFIQYAMLAIFTLVVLAVHSAAQVTREGNAPAPTLPTFEPRQKSKDASMSRSRAPSTSVSSNNRLQARSTNARTRSVSPAAGTYSLPTVRPGGGLIEKAGYYGSNVEYEEHNLDKDADDTDEWGNPFVERKPSKPRSFGSKVGDRFGRNMIGVAGPVLVVYWWLLRRG